MVVWWLRGIIAAWAIVGIVDQLGIGSDLLLRVVHAIGARWNIIAETVSGWINIALPFDLQLTASEVTISTINAAIVLPLGATAVWSLVDTTRKASRPLLAGALGIAGACALLFLGLSPFLPGELIEDPTLAGWFSGAISTVVALAVFQAILHHAGAPALKFAVLGAGFLGMAISTFFDVGPWIVPLYLFGILTPLWIVARSYTKALIISLTFVATLEALYLAPGLREVLQPIVDAIDPSTHPPETT